MLRGDEQMAQRCSGSVARCHYSLEVVAGSEKFQIGHVRPDTVRLGHVRSRLTVKVLSK